MSSEGDSNTGRFVYLDFEIEIGLGEGLDYPVKVLRSPAGEASEIMHFPFNEDALKYRILELQNALLRSGGKRRLIPSKGEQTVQNFGRELFDALFTGEVRSRFDISQERASNQDKGLRLKLIIQSPKMAAIPWEFLYDTSRSVYVCMSGNTPFIRYLSIPQPNRPLTVNLPLQILGMIANPKDLPELSIDDEKQRVKSALKGLTSAGLVKLTWVEGQTVRHLQRAMRTDKWHVFYFIGHGSFDTNIDEGLIALSNESGNSHMLRATDLALLITDNRALRLVLLNSCDGAQSGENDIFSSTASILLRRGVPAVLAMQYEITDRASIEFSTALYEALVDGLPVDAAVNEARKSIKLNVNNTLEWGVPVLFMRSPDGVLFQVEKRPEPISHSPSKESVGLPPKPETPPIATRKRLAVWEKPQNVREKEVETSIPAQKISLEKEFFKEEVILPPDFPKTVPQSQRIISTAVSTIVGIDFGTTNSSVAIMEGGEPTIIPSVEGERLVPSVIAANKNHERLIGRIAHDQAVVNPENTIFSIKRFMGRKFNDPEIQKLIRRLPYTVTQAPNGDIRVILDGKGYSPPEIAAMILAKLKANAEVYLGRIVTQAVITVPAYFNDAQRNAIRDAGRIAGLDVLRIINEPTATSLSYGLDKKKDEVIAVYHLGGGTFDISILNVGDGVFSVRSTNGNTFLGGDDFDLRIIDYIADEFEKENKIDLRKDRQALQRLREAAEKAKIELSSMVQTEINLPYVTADASGPKHLVMPLTRTKLEQLTSDLVERSMNPVRQALKDAGVSPENINEVVLAGGMTRMPAVQKAVRKLFGKDPHKGVNPDEVVAVGAAIQAGVLGGDVKDILLLDVTPLTLSVETLGGVATPLIERNTTVPTRKSQIYSTASDGQSQVEINVLQGERPMAADNKSLGRFILDGIPTAPRGVPQIEVTFDIDANGIIKVTALDKATSRSQHITITASSGLSEAEVERMRKEAEAHKAEDDKRKENIEARNAADNAIYTAEKALRDLGDKVPADIKTIVEQQVIKVRELMKSENKDEILLATQKLINDTQKMSSTANGTVKK